MKSIPSTVVKTYPQRGPLQQFRFADSSAFHCFRCGRSKKSKLITVYGGDWTKRTCNGCYGRLLSLFEIKAGTAADDQRAEELAAALLSTVGIDDQRRAENLLKTTEERAAHLCPEALRFVATAEHVATYLSAEPQLEWSPAVIGLCKAIEAEVVSRVLRPLADRVSGEDISGDTNDNDLRRVAMFCTEPTGNPPELGAFAHFLQTVVHSQQRRGSSPLIQSFLDLARSWSGSSWLLDSSGFHSALTALTSRYRNRAAHIDELGKSDYDGCREHSIGSEGLLWEIVLATSIHK